MRFPSFCYQTLWTPKINGKKFFSENGGEGVQLKYSKSNTPRFEILHFEDHNKIKIK